MNRRENTFRIDYSNIPKKPPYDKILSFCATVLELKANDVLRVQCSRALNCVFVKVASLELAKQICETHDAKHMVTIEDKSYPLRITMEDGALEVKLFDLSEDVSDKAIANFLGKYGDVISIREQKYSHPDFPLISTGVRIVKMMVKQNIESYVTIDGETTLVSYFGQRQTCRHCREFVHVGATCVQNKKLLVQKSYADAAKQPSNKKMATKPTAVPAKKLAAYTNSPTQNLSAKQRAEQQTKLMPPPAAVDIQSPMAFPALPSTSESQDSSMTGSSPITPGQRPQVTGVIRKPSASQSDGHETDGSMASQTSEKKRGRGRPPKKRREQDEESDDIEIEL